MRLSSGLIVLCEGVFGLTGLLQTGFELNKHCIKEILLIELVNVILTPLHS